MTINAVIFIKYLSDLYTLQISRGFSENLPVQGLRYYSKEADLKHYILLCIHNDMQPPLHNNNLIVTDSKKIYDKYQQQLPMVWIQNLSDPPEEFYNAVAGLWEKLVIWDQTLNEISLTQKSFQKLLDCCDNIVAEPIALINNYFHYVAYSQRLSRQRGYIDTFVDASNTVSMDITTQLIINPEYGKLCEKHGPFEFMDDYHFIACNIFSENIYIGRLISICTENKMTDTYQKHVIAHLAVYVEKMYQQNGTFFLEEPVMTQLHDLFSQSLQGSPIPPDSWISLLTGLGWKYDDTYVIVNIQPTFRYEKNLYPDYLCPQIEQHWPFTIAVVLDNCLIVLINQSQAKEEYSQELAYFLRDNLMCAGVSRIFFDLSNIQAAFRQSTQALDFGRRKKPHFWYHHFDDYAFDHILQHAHSDYEASQICHPALLKLRRHDKQHGTQYYKTLYVWFKNRFNSVASAKDLYIHRTTFIKRMEHIREMTGLDLENWDTVVYLTISFKLFSDEV